LNQLSVKKAISLSINGEDVYDFYNDEMIQSFSNRKIAQLSDGELRYLEIVVVLCSPVKFVL
jgi:predicted ATPase